MRSDDDMLPPPKLSEPSQNKNKEGLAITVAKTTIVTAAGKYLGERLADAFNPSDESVKWMEPYRNAALCLGTFTVMTGVALKDKKPPFVSKLMMNFGAALTFAGMFAPIVALLQPPVAIAFTVVATSIFGATAVMLCQG